MIFHKLQILFKSLVIFLKEKKIKLDQFKYCLTFKLFY